MKAREVMTDISSVQHERFTFDAWIDLGRELYGDNKLEWEFVCPNCKLIQSFEKMREHREKLKGWQPYTECVGRYGIVIDEKKGLGCDWAAYGLFSGPVEVLENDEKTHKAWAFRFAKHMPEIS